LISTVTVCLLMASPQLDRRTPLEAPRESVNRELTQRHRAMRQQRSK
jgi:hypothetical protein